MQPTTHHPVDPPPPKLGHHRPSPPIVQPDFGLQQGDTANEISGSAPTLQPAVADERAAPYVSSPVAAAAAKAATLLATAATSRSGSVVSRVMHFSMMPEDGGSQLNDARHSSDFVSAGGFPLEPAFVHDVFDAVGLGLASSGDWHQQRRLSSFQD